MTRVVNIRTESYDVYIGRPGKGQDGYFGNPFRLEYDELRGSTIERYKKWFYKRINEDHDFREAIHKLEGKVLGCFCKPQACHGDVIVNYLEN